MNLSKISEYTERGPRLTIEADWSLSYKDFKVFDFPASCAECPAGFSKNNCGRNVPLKAEDYNSRPQSCKLKKISTEDIIAKLKETFELMEATEG